MKLVLIGGAIAAAVSIAAVSCWLLHRRSIRLGASRETESEPEQPAPPPPEVPLPERDGPPAAPFVFDPTDPPSLRKPGSVLGETWEESQEEDREGIPEETRSDPFAILPNEAEKAIARELLSMLESREMSQFRVVDSVAHPGIEGWSNEKRRWVARPGRIWDIPRERFQELIDLSREAHRKVRRETDRDGRH